MTHVTGRLWLSRTGISSGTLCSVIEYGLRLLPCLGDEFSAAVDVGDRQPRQRSDVDSVWCVDIPARRLAHQVPCCVPGQRSRQLRRQCFRCLHLGVGDPRSDRGRRTHHQVRTSSNHWRFHAWVGGEAQPPESWLAPQM